MKQIKNGFCDYYYLLTDGTVINKELNKKLKHDSKYCYRLRTIDGEIKRIALKTLYKKIYNRPYCEDNIDNLDGEEWKEIDGTNGNYYVSNLGRIKSYNNYKALLLKPYITNGYQRVDIVIDGHRFSKLVHRLVAASFLEAPKTIDMVLHHKDGVKQNNKSVNLEWLTHKEHIDKHNTKEI